MTDENLTTTEILSDDEIELAPEAEAPKAPLSVEDAVRQAHSELQERDETETDKSVSGNKGASAKKPVNEELSKAASTLAKSRKKVVEKADLDLGAPEEKLIPPGRWTLEKKEWFNKQPKEVQEEALRGWSDIETGASKVVQDLQREKGRYEEVNRIVDHYLPQWGVKGMTPGQAIAELCAAQDYLLKNPVEGLATIMQRAGISVDDLSEYLDSGGVQSQQPQAPANPALTADQIREIWREEQQRTAEEAEIQQGQAQFHATMNEVGPDGRYLFPELHNPAFVDRLRPLAIDLKRRQPDLSWGEATKRIVHTLRLVDGTGQPASTGFAKPTNQQQELAKARAASVSIRGRGNPGIPTQAKLDPGLSVEDTVRATYYQLYER